MGVNRSTNAGVENRARFSNSFLTSRYTSGSYQRSTRVCIHYQGALFTTTGKYAPLNVCV
jgi:hypothetical protein